jgi:hypothetical protein
VAGERRIGNGPGAVGGGARAANLVGRLSSGAAFGEAFTGSVESTPLSRRRSYFLQDFCADPVCGLDQAKARPDIALAPSRRSLVIGFEDGDHSIELPQLDVVAVHERFGVAFGFIIIRRIGLTECAPSVAPLSLHSRGTMKTRRDSSSLSSSQAKCPAAVSNQVHRAA